MAKELEKDHDYYGHVAKALGEPVFFEPNPQTLKIKTQLLATSVIAIIIVHYQLKIGKESSILGLRIENLNDGVAHSVLFGIILYLLGSFIWSSIDGFGEWRLRITGSKVAFQGVSTFADGHSDYPKDPRQSTLYNWWKEQALKIGNIGQQAKEANDKINSLQHEIQQYLQGLSGKEPLNINHVQQTGTSAINAIQNLTNKLEELRKTFLAERIPTSLKRFDDWFFYFLKSQNIRWFTMDFLLPLILGVTALMFLGKSS